MEAFKATRSKILGKNPRFMRSGDWTTNRFWAIKTALEPKFLSELKVTDQSQPDVEKIIAKEGKTVKMTVTGIFATAGKQIYALLNSKELDPILNVWVNAYFLSMFQDAKFYCEFYCDGEKEPVFVKVSGQTIGVIMPVSFSNDYIKE